MSNLSQLYNQIQSKLNSDPCNPSQQYGIIYKIHGHFYYASNLLTGETENLIPLTLPSRMKKENIQVYVGDLVQYDSQDKIIKKVEKRLSLLPRPKVANIDRAIIVISYTEPAIDFEYLDRLLCHAGISLPNRPIICLTKIDLINSNKEIEIKAQDILKDYASLGYTIFPICNKTGEGLKELRLYLNDSFSVLAGHSGVGKSSLIKALCENQNISIGEVSKKNEKGTHTTRHSQIYDIKLKESHFKLLDTPGFSRLDSQFSVAEMLDGRAFPEINVSKQQCQFSDCKHLDEIECQVSFSESRKKSYRKLITEAENLEKHQKENKNEIGNVKISGSGSHIPILRNSLRTISRKRFKQQNSPEEDS